MGKKRKRKPSGQYASQPPNYPKGSKFVGGPIEAKPTTYRGIQFKSRLEARWAVYLDFHPFVDSWYYEPRTFRLADRGWDYTPDFLVKAGTIINCWVEVKPTIPTDEYLAVLSSFVPLLPDCIGHHLLLFTGDFFQSLPQVFGMIPGVMPTGKQVAEYNEELTAVPIIGHSEAAEVASKYRFDLPEQTPPLKSTKGMTPFDHWREWQQREAGKNRPQ